MFQKIFNPDNPLMITLSHITDCIFLSLFWIICSMPVLTMGASFAALYDASFRAYRQGEKHSWQRFFSVFKDNLKPGILPSLVFVVLFGILAKLMILLWNKAAGGEMSWMVFAGLALIGVAVLGILSILFPTLSRFENKFGALLKNSLFLSLANLPRTLVVGLINTATLLLCLRFIVPLFFLPALAALFDSFLIEPMFKPYMPDEEQSDSEISD